MGFPPASQASVSFKGNQEEKLEKIMIQKWIALYPNGQEAWSEWRRTGYPRMQTVYRNNSNGLIDSEKGIRRMHYTIRETQTEVAEEMQISVKSVHRYKQKAIEQLRNVLKDYLPLALLLMAHFKNRHPL